MLIREAIINYSKLLAEMEFESSNLDVEILLSYVLGCTRVDLINNATKELTENELINFCSLFNRRVKHEPIAYIINEKEFCGNKFYVSKDVLIPRPLTEELVELIYNEIFNFKKSSLNIIDVGTGSGAIILSLAKKLEYKESVMKNIYNDKNYCFYASDISKKAVNIAKVNSERLNIKNINFLLGNLKFPKNIKFDLIIANLPYLNKDIINFSDDNTKDLLYEPKNALFASKNGLKHIFKLLKKSEKYLDDGGKLYLEIERGQAEILKNKFKKYKFTEYFEGRIVVIERFLRE